MEVESNMVFVKAAVSSLRSWRDHSLKQQSFGRGATKLAENRASTPEIFSHTRKTVPPATEASCK